MGAATHVADHRAIVQFGKITFVQPQMRLGLVSTEFPGQLDDAPKIL